jgi:GTP-binding protein
MRREGFELSISRPRVVYRVDEETGQRLEPIEEVVIDVDDEYSGVVVEKLSARKAELKDMRPSGSGKTRITLEAPSRGADRLSGRIPHRHARVRRAEPPVQRLRAAPVDRSRVACAACLISNSDGDTAAYALWNLEERGVMFVGAGGRPTRA